MSELLADSGVDIEQMTHQARALAGQGRFLDAIALGQKANRRHSNAALEIELASWRHQAFYEAKDHKARPDWPPRLADPRPDLINRIPEIDAKDISPELVGGAIQNHGSLILRGLLPAERMPIYVDAIDKAFEARKAEAGGGQSAYAELESKNGNSVTGERLFAGSSGLLMVDSPHFLAMWMDEIANCGVLGAVSSYLGERPAISAAKATLYRLPPNPGSQWHQDGAFLGRDIRTVNLWVACTECGVDAPGLDIVPWRINEIVEIGTHGSLFHWSVGEALVEQLAGNRPITTPHFMPGDAMLFDQLCLHRTSARPHQKYGRYAIETWMFAPSHYREGVPLVT